MRSSDNAFCWEDSISATRAWTAAWTCADLPIAFVVERDIPLTDLVTDAMLLLGVAEVAADVERDAAAAEVEISPFFDAPSTQR